MRREFHKWQRALENLPDFWAVRWCKGLADGLLWRNRAARDYYAPLGFFPAETLPWSGVRQYMDSETLARVSACFAETFATRGVVRLVHTAQATPQSPPIQVAAWFAHAGGEVDDGLIVTHWQSWPLS